MCFSGQQAAFFSAFSLVGAGYAYYRWGTLRLSIAILYFGAMELLQAIQYLYIAEPEDNYAMCKDPTNQFLTVIGLLHICFQPVFANMYLRALTGRQNIQERIERDLVHKMCVVAGVWLFSRYIVAAYFPDLPHMAPRATKECPNYEWINDGYDAGIGWETPNLPGHSCTFRSNTPTGHIAWASPLYQPTYFVPGASVHSFLMFVPGLFGKTWKLEILLFLTGPMLASRLTASNHEQASIWCFYSMYQVIAGVIILFFRQPLQAKPISKLVHRGGLGDGLLEYMLVPKAVTKDSPNK